MSSRRRRPCSPLDDDDLLSEILLRLPPQPSSLPRASLVSNRWRLLVSDPRFARRFRVRHRRSPPLLGCFVQEDTGLSFVPAMEAPNRVPPGRLSLQLDHGHLFKPLGCRHGLALISGRPRQQLLVWDPLTGEQHHLPVPPGFDPETTPGVNGAVLRRAAAGDVHFQVVFVAAGKTGALACVYSSETGTWGDLVSMLVRRVGIFYARFCDIVSPEHAVLVGDSLYWQLTSCASSILEFDLEKRSLAVIPVPVNANHHTRIFRVTRAVGGGLGFLFVSGFAAQLWERIVDCDGVASWVLARSVELDKLLSLGSEVRDEIEILGIAEENNTVFLTTGIDAYALQLQSLQFKKLSEFNITDDCYPFESVYTADIGGNEHDEAALLHNA